MMPPSAAPMSKRAPSIMTNDDAIPVRNEQPQNATVAITRSPLREPVLSETRPIPKAAIAQVSESAPARIPTWVLFRCRSGWMNGIRKFEAFRSKKTIPKLMLSSAASITW
jgi:hypothetical protein